MFGTKLTLSRKENQDSVLKRSLGAIGAGNGSNFCSFFFWQLLVRSSFPLYFSPGGTPIHFLYGYVPPNGVVILKLLI